jgi:uncharacterized integral membrane protein
MGAGAGDTARRWLRRIKIGAVLTAIVLVLIVIFQNNEKATFYVLFWDAEMPRLLLPLAAFAAGGVAGAVVALYLARRRRG